MTIAAKCERCGNFLNFCHCNWQWQKMSKVETIENIIQEQDKWETFGDGYTAAKKEFSKVITDSLNKYKSWLSDAKHTKLSKRISPEEILRLESKIEVLEEIKRKLW